LVTYPRFFFVVGKTVGAKVAFHRIVAAAGVAFNLLALLKYSHRIVTVGATYLLRNIICVHSLFSEKPDRFKKIFKTCQVYFTCLSADA
jgi:hypothetical protein